MRSLLTLSFAFALLAAYLEIMISPASASMQPTLSTKIIRQPLKAVTKPEQQIAFTTSPYKQAKSHPALNLQLPLSTSDQTLILHHNPKTTLFFNQTPKQTISYNAELVFDAERGENITGGKVNITIPLG